MLINVNKYFLTSNTTIKAHLGAFLQKYSELLKDIVSFRKKRNDNYANSFSDVIF